MQVAAIEVLVHKGKFDPQIAVAIAEAIDMTINNSQLVTVPVLDSHMARIDARFAHIDVRFAQVEAKMQRLKNELILWIIAMTVGNAFLPKLAAVIGSAMGGGHADAVP